MPSGARRTVKPAPGPPRLTRAASGPHLSKRCTATARSGERCKSAPLRNKKLCALHTPGVAAKLGTKGGHRRAIYAPEGLASFLAPQNAGDLKTLLGASIIELRAGRLDPRLASSLGYLGAGFLKALETSDLEARLAALEKQSAGAKA